MSIQNIEKNEENQNSKIQLPAVVQPETYTLTKTKEEALRIDIVSGAIADEFVRYDGSYYHVDHIGARLRQRDAMSLARKIIRTKFPHEYGEPGMVNKTLSKVFGDDPDEPSKSIDLWDGKTRCAPGNHKRVLRGPMMASVNTWVNPVYRTKGVKDADLSELERFLGWTFVHGQDKERFLDWLAWCLQNESGKPGWAPLLYSREKGTGKSTLCKLATRLFGKENTFSANGVSKVTGQFNKPLLDSKLLVLEELKLNPTSNQGNSLKTFITEKDTSAERKGVDVEKVEQCCCFVFTTNHLPQWIEGNDRRFHVIDMGHEGHASGPKAQEFAKFMVEFHQWMEDDENIARLYNALMQRKVSEDFNPKSLNTSKITTPVMEQIRATSQEAMLQQLQEELEEDGRGAIPQEKLIAMFRDQHMNANRIPHMMPDLGWKLTKAKWGGKDYTRAIWVKPGYAIYRGRVTGPEGYDHPIDKQPGFSGFLTLD